MKLFVHPFVVAFFVAANGAVAEPIAFIQSHQGVTFEVTSPNDSSINPLQLRASIADVPLLNETLEADGTITGIEVDDLDANGYPEIYIYVSSAGSGSYGSLIARASNRNKSLTPIYLPPMTDDPKAAQGYRGHDEFAVVENALIRRFPRYLAADSNAEPTGGMRQIQYHLVAGEATWRLEPYRVVDF